MALIKVIELLAESKKSWEDAPKIQLPKHQNLSVISARYISKILMRK